MEPLMQPPRFDEPTFTVPAEQLFGADLPGVAPQNPLPVLIEGDGDEVSDPSDEPLVPVEHRRIRTLANYWHGGWEHAIAGTLLRSEAAARLYSVADGLPSRWGLAVFDAWRPLTLQAELYDAAYADPLMEPGFMAPVSRDPATPPPHLTGGAVDLSLTFDGTPVAPGCGFDDTTRLAHAREIEGREGPAREVRRFLYWSMRTAGFVVFDCEWWHFEFGTRRWSLITGGPASYGPAAPESS